MGGAFILWVVLQTGMGNSAQTQLQHAEYKDREACELAGQALKAKFGADYICTDKY